MPETQGVPPVLQLYPYHGNYGIYRHTCSWSKIGSWRKIAAPAIIFYIFYRGGYWLQQANFILTQSNIHIVHTFSGAYVTHIQYYQ